MRKFYLLLLFTAVSFITRAQVSVTATAGTTGPTPYTTLKGAFDAINAGTHQGAINISLSGGTTETAAAALNATGGTASYTSVIITATAPVTITGNLTTAIIKLNGADNVTIDGRIGGTGRNITVTNTSTSASSAIWLSSTAAGAGATNNTIRNLEVACGAAQNTGTTSTFGILMNGAAVSATSDGNDNDNNTFTENRIIRCRYGITTRGVSANLNQTVTITNNIIGPASFGADEIGKVGIFMQFDNNALISGNTVQYVGGDFANTSGGADRVAIAIGLENWTSSNTPVAGSNYTVTKNTIHDIIEERTFSSLGVLLAVTNGAAATNSLVANNFIYNVKANGTSGDATVGIGTSGGNGDFIIFNSVRMAGDLDPNAGASAATQTAACIRVSNTPANLSIKNNILYTDVSSSSSPTLNAVCIMMPSATIAWGTGGLNNNDYYTVNGTTRTGAIGTASLATTFFTTLANWQAALTPAQDGASKAVNPNFTSATDLHIPTGSSSQLESGGVASGGVTVDIDNDVRPGPAGSINGGGTAPDIGADEFDAIPLDLSAPAISYTALTFTCNTSDRVLSNVIITDGSGVPTSGAFVPRIYYRKNAGTWFSQPGSLSGGNGINGTWVFVIVAADMGGMAGGDVIQYYVIAQDVATTPNVSSNPSGVTATSVTAVSVHPSSPNSFNISSALAGTYSVGVGQTYTTLTAAIAAYNISCLSGPVVFELTDATYNEAAAMTINLNPDASATNTLTIRPASGVTASVSAAVSNTAMLKIQGSYITIDGSNNGTGTRNLTFTNTSVTLPNVLAVTSLGTTPVTQNTIKNCIVINGVNTSTAMVVSDGTTIGNPGYFNNITIKNNSIQKAYMGAYCNAAVAAGNGNNLLLDSNSLITSGANAIRFTGLYVQGADGAIVRNNEVANFESATSETDNGIWLASGNTNTVVERNNIHDITYTASNEYGPRGIAVSSGNANANISIRNNMIRNIAGDGDSYTSFGAQFSPSGIYVFGAGQTGVSIQYNTIYMSGNTIDESASFSFGIAVDDGSVVSLKNNIIHNSLGRLGTLGVGTVAIGLELTASQIASSNYNDFYVAATGGGGNFFGKIGGTNYTTLAAWQAAISGDANSVNILPVYVSATDIHLNPVSNTALNGLGNPIAGITTDYDMDTRDAATPDMGADEFTLPPCTAAAGTTVASPTGPFCSPGATTLSLSGAGIGTGTSYQWQTSPDGISWTDSAGQTSPTMSVTGLMATRWYQCLVGCTATGTFSSSTPVQIVVTAGPTATVTPNGAIYLCTPSTQLLNVATNAATPSYQWKLAGTNIGGAITSSYTVTASGTYTVTITDAATTCFTTSLPVVVFIDPPPPSPIISPANTTMCENAAPVAITITNGSSAAQLAFGTQATQNTGTVASTDYPAPYTLYYGGQRMQMLVRASELTAAGYIAGVQFTDIQFPVVSRGANWGVTTTACQNFQVSIGHTALTTLSTFQTGLTQVYTPTSFTPTVGYTNTHTFNTPFSWDGSSNIIIETTFSNNVFGTLADLVVQYNSPTAFQSCVVYRVDNGAPATVATAATPTYTYSARPDFKLNGGRSANFTWSPIAGLYTDALGTIPYTGLSANTVYAQPSGTTTYTATSCSTSGTATVNVTSSTTLAAATGGPQRCNTSTVSPAGTYFHIGGACGLIAKVTPSGSPAVSGSVDACVRIDASVLTDPYNVPYVQRHYDITPATGAATAQALITLYFLQSEFDAFNTYVTTNALSFPLLPTGGANNGNIKITQFHGTGTAPGNYTGAPELIIPSGIVWNAVKGWWEITFPVMGFSGFYLHTGSKSLLPIPFNSLRLNAEITGASNRVYWTTETEENNKKFMIERSADGRNFIAVGELGSRATGGNSATPVSYSFADERPLNGKQYYRLRVIKLNGSEELTQIVMLRRGAVGIDFASVRPNPTSGIVYLNITGTHNDVTIVVRNMEGKEVLRTVKQPNMEFAVNIGNQPGGVYTLEATDTQTGMKAMFKLVKH